MGLYKGLSKTTYWLTFIVISRSVSTQDNITTFQNLRNWWRRLLLIIHGRSLAAGPSREDARGRPSCFTTSLSSLLFRFKLLTPWKSDDLKKGFGNWSVYLGHYCVNLIRTNRSATQGLAQHFIHKQHAAKKSSLKPQFRLSGEFLVISWVNCYIFLYRP